MRDLIHEKLNKMADLDQRKMLRDIMNGCFYHLVNEQEEANKGLEARVFNEIEDARGKYDICFTVCHKDDVDPLDEFLHPVFPEEMKTKKYDMKEIAQKAMNKAELKLFTVFMKCGHEEIKKLSESQRSFQGTLVTNKSQYPIKIRLEHNRRYLAEIENLYYIFQKNGLPWKTINNPYAGKFFDVILTGCEGRLDENEEIKEISLPFGEYEQYKMNDRILLWNIERKRENSSGFPVQAEDRVNYRHTVSLNKLGGPENGYLVAGEEESPVRYVMHTPEELVIVSSNGRAAAWNILKIKQLPQVYDKKYEFPLASNRQKSSFINRFAQKQATVLRTKGEIARLANSFEASKYFEFLETELGNGSSEAGTYDVNAFIFDDIRAGCDKKVLRLKFRALEKDSFILLDLLSFMVSEIQMLFPEFRCEGELV